MYIQSNDFKRLPCRPPLKKTSRRRLDLLQVERLGASVLLLAGGAGLLELELAGGDGVLAALVGAGSDGLGDLQDKATVSLGDGEGAGRLLAGAVGDLGQGAVGAGDLGTALDGGGLAVAGLDHTELVAVEAVCQHRNWHWRGMARQSEWMVAGNNLHALSAVGNARRREVRGLEDSLSASHGGSGDSEDGGGELHLDECCGFGVGEESWGCC